MVARFSGIQKFCRRLWGFPLWIRLALIVGIVIHLVAFIFVMFPYEEPYEKKTPPAFIHLTQTNTQQAIDLFDEQLELFDTEPLLLHTRWNYRTPLTMNKLLPGQGAFFAPYPANVALNETIKKTGDRSQSEFFSNDTLFEKVLAPEVLGVIEGFGVDRKPQATPQSPVIRGRIYSLNRANSEHTFVLRVDEGESVLNSLWAPLKIQYFIHPGAYASQPLIKQSSGNTQVDAILVEKINQIISRLDLASGYYLIEVGA